MARMLVTGGAGFIGSHLCEALLRRGDEVTALDNFDDFYDPQVKRRNLSSVRDHPRFRLIEGDIRDAALVQSLIGGGTHCVVHLAARAGVSPSLELPLLYQDVNVRGTLTLLEACRRNPNCKFIFGSSSSVYGNNAKLPFSEGDRVDFPVSPYAATKVAGELLCRTYHHLFAFDVTCLRFFTVYGPGQRPDLAIHQFVRLMHDDRAIPVFGDGQTARDYTYIDDIIDGVLRACDRCAGFHTYNLGGSQPMILSDLIRMIEHALGRRAVVERLGPRPGDVDRTFADIQLARQELGFAPRTELAAGLARFVEWFRKDR